MRLPQQHRQQHARIHSCWLCSTKGRELGRRLQKQLQQLLLRHQVTTLPALEVLQQGRVKGSLCLLLCVLLRLCLSGRLWVPSWSSMASLRAIW